jgi:hypothetical protein
VFLRFFPLVYTNPAHPFSDMNTRRLALVLALFSATSAFMSVRAETTSETAKSSGYVNASFSRLASYTFSSVIEDDPVKLAALYNQEIPAEIKNLDGKKAVISGFMLPVKVSKGVVTELLLMKDQQSCCYGATPNLNDFVIVRMPEGKGKLMIDTPIFIYGTLKVGAVLENGFLAGVYQLDGDKMEM